VTLDSSIDDHEVESVKLNSKSVNMISRRLLLGGFLASSLLGCAAEGAEIQGTTDPTVEGMSESAYCESDSYLNVKGECVTRPQLSGFVPVGATARCRKKQGEMYWYSFSRTRRGSCSQFGGVLAWCTEGRCEEARRAP